MATRNNEKYLMVTADHIDIAKFKHICKKKRFPMASQLREHIKREIAKYEKLHGVIQLESEEDNAK